MRVGKLETASELTHVGFDLFFVGGQTIGLHELTDFDGRHLNAVLFEHVLNGFNVFIVLFHRRLLTKKRSFA